jgi:membrane protein
MTDGPVPPQTGADSQLDSPLELEKPDLKESLKRTFKEFKRDRATMISAGMAYYWFLAIFPALLAAVGILGLVDASPSLTEDINKAIRSTLPGDAARVLTDAVSQAPGQSGASIVAAVLGILLSLWSASAGMVALQSGLDVAYDIPEDRKFVKKRLVALELILVTTLLGGEATTLMFFGQPLGDALRSHLPFGGAFILVWTLIRWAGALIALILLFATFYYLGPNRETPRWVWVSPGGILGVIIWLLSSVGFSFYVSNLGSYGKTYGSLTGVVVLMLWLYLTALAVVLGGELNAELERQSAMKSGATGSARTAVPAHADSQVSHSAWGEAMSRIRRPGS